jgi:hypothetical protein
MPRTRSGFTRASVTQQLCAVEVQARCLVGISLRASRVLLTNPLHEVVMSRSRLERSGRAESCRTRRTTTARQSLAPPPRPVVGRDSVEPSLFPLLSGARRAPASISPTRVPEPASEPMAAAVPGSCPARLIASRFAPHRSPALRFPMGHWPAACPPLHFAGREENSSVRFGQCRPLV